MDVLGGPGPEDAQAAGVPLGDVQGQLVAFWQAGGASDPQQHRRHVLQIWRRQQTSPSDLEETTDISFRSGGDNRDISFRSGGDNRDMSFRSGGDNRDMSFRSGGDNRDMSSRYSTLQD